MCRSARARTIDDVRERIALSLVLAVAVGCGGSGAASPSASRPPSLSPSASPPTTAAEITKPPFSQPPLPAPTYVLWAIDRSAQTDRPYTFELHHDGVASGFRVVDASGKVVLAVPIAGSGIFGPETCMAAVQIDHKSSGATWRSIDDAAYRDLVARAASYRVEVDTIGHGTVTLPLTDSGCRRV